MGWLLHHPEMEGEIVLAGHRNGLDGLSARLAFASIQRVMVRDARETQASVRVLADFEEASKTEWAELLQEKLDDAAENAGKSSSAKSLSGIRQLQALMAAQQTGNFGK